MAQDSSDVALVNARRATDEHNYLEVVAITQALVNETLSSGPVGVRESEILYLYATAIINLERHLEPREWTLCSTCLEEALSASPDATSAACCLIQLAGLWFARQHGDVVWNHAKAVEVGKEAIRIAAETNNARLVSLCATNLGVAIRNSAPGDPASLEEAHDLLSGALAMRPIEEDIQDWAFTMLNLGLAELDIGLLANPPNALPALERLRTLTTVLPADRYPSLMAHSMHGLARSLLADTGGPHEEELLASLESCVSLASEPRLLGQALHLLSEFRHRQGDHLGAMAVEERALAALEGLGNLDILAPIVRVLGSQYADNGDWSQAARVFRSVVDKIAMAIENRFSLSTLALDLELGGNIARWCAMASFKTGEAARAVGELETGRGRSLGLLAIRHDETERLQRLAPDLAVEWHELAREMRQAWSSDDENGRSRQLLQERRSLLGRIRSHPELADFMARADMGSITASLAEGDRMLYVDPTPWGTLILRLSAEGVVDGQVIEGVTSMDVVENVVGTESQRRLGQVLDDGEVFDGELQHSLSHALAWVGSMLGPALLHATGGATSVTLYISGPLSLVPIHLAPIRVGGSHRCLADSLPSAIGISASLRPTPNRGNLADPVTPTDRFAGVADPTDLLGGHLAAAPAEAEAIAGTFVGPTEIAIGERATVSRVEYMLRSAQVMHIASHASGAVFDLGSAGIELADGRLSLRQIVALAPLETKLITLSACESGVQEVHLMTEEALSLASCFVTAGADNVVASMWAVDDLATCYLMVEFYRRLLEHPQVHISEVLYRAQQWLQRLSMETEQVFLARNPDLQRALDREGVRPACESPADRPFADAEYWAPFVVFR